MKNENVNIELEGLSKTLANLPKVEDKDIPEGYFESLPDITWKKISSAQEVEVTKKTRVLPLAAKVLGVAASFALLFFIVQGIGTNQVENEIPVDSMVEFILNDVDDLDEAFLFELSSVEYDVAELDETLEYMLEEEIDMIDDKILETLY